MSANLRRWRAGEGQDGLPFDQCLCLCQLLEGLRSLLLSGTLSSGDAPLSTCQAPAEVFRASSWTASPEGCGGLRTLSSRPLRRSAGDVPVSEEEHSNQAAFPGPLSQIDLKLGQNVQLFIGEPSQDTPTAGLAASYPDDSSLFNET
ncbi:unnamed protein product [Arctogadus glacialis]